MFSQSKPTCILFLDCDEIIYFIENPPIISFFYYTTFKSVATGLLQQTLTNRQRFKQCWPLFSRTLLQLTSEAGYTKWPVFLVLLSHFFQFKYARI